MSDRQTDSRQTDRHGVLIRLLVTALFVLDICNSRSVYTMGTRGAWARDFLVALGNPNPSAKTVNLVAAWTKAEGGTAHFNPLNTTLDYGQNTKYNDVGVRNYANRADGIAASVITLRGNFIGYAKTLRGLQTDDSELALDGMLTPGMPWGTNFGTVAAYYRTKDVTGEDLPNETGSTRADDSNTTRPNNGHDSGPTSGHYTPSPHSGGSVPRTVPQGTKSDTGMVTEDSLRTFGKVLLGIGLALTGGLLIIKSFITIDNIRTAAKIASVA